MMSQHAEYFKQAELAFASYTKNLTAGIPDRDKLINDAEFSATQADAFILKYEVVDQHTDATGLSATVLADKNTGETFLAIRGTEISDPADLLTGLVNIALFGSTTLQPQYQSLKTQVQTWLNDGVLPQTFTVTGHSLGGFLATDLAVDSTFTNNISHAYLYNTPGQGGIFGDLLNMMQNTWGIPTQYDPAKFSNIEAVVSDGFNISPVAELGTSFLCATLDINTYPRPDHASYIANWLQVLKEHKTAIFLAASAASRASMFLESLAAENK